MNTGRVARRVAPAVLVALVAWSGAVGAPAAGTEPSDTSPPPVQATEPPAAEPPLLPQVDGWIAPDQTGFVAYLGQRKALHDVWVYPAFGRTVQLQRQQPDGTWVEVSSYTTAEDAVYDVVHPRLPQVEAAGPAKYRLHAPATAWDPEVSSPVIAVDHQDPEQHRTLRDAATDAIQPWCPGTSVAVGMPMPPDLVGVSWTWTGEIGVVAGLPKDELIATALHECAHVLQAELPLDPVELEKRLLAIHGPLVGWEPSEVPLPGTEQNADCVAELMGAPVPGPYTTRCDGDRRAAAEAVLAGRAP